MDLTTRVNLLRNLSKSKKPQITVREAAKLLKVNRTSAYYTHRTRIYSQEELDCKAIIDHLHTDNPAWGARQMARQLQGVVTTSAGARQRVTCARWASRLFIHR